MGGLVLSLALLAAPPVAAAPMCLAMAAPIVASASLGVPAMSALILGAASPWEEAVTKIADSFRGPIAKGLSIVAIVVAGLMIAFSESSSKTAIAGLLFGVGMAVAATNFLGWLFKATG